MFDLFFYIYQGQSPKVIRGVEIESALRTKSTQAAYIERELRISNDQDLRTHARLVSEHRETTKAESRLRKLVKKSQQKKRSTIITLCEAANVNINFFFFDLFIFNLVFFILGEKGE